MSRSRVVALAAVVLVALAVPASPAAAAGPDRPIAVDAVGGDGRGRIQSPGRSCADGGQGAYWHADHRAVLAPGVLTGSPADLTVLLELHSDAIRRPNSVNLPPPGNPVNPPTAFLPAGESRAVLGNERGTISLGLAAGTCAAPAVLFNGRTASGQGQWTVEGGTGSYAGVAGSGPFSFVADVDPGADNPWRVTLGGALNVPQPAITATVAETFWGNLGTDYVTRRVSVTYTLTNTGPGDAFGIRVKSTASPTPGVTPLGPHNQKVVDLHAGESTTVTVRYQFGLLQPCALVILSCPFVSTVTTTWFDALDLPGQSVTAGIPAKAPDLPMLLP